MTKEKNTELNPMDDFERASYFIGMMWAAPMRKEIQTLETMKAERQLIEFSRLLGMYR